MNKRALTIAAFALGAIVSAASQATVSYALAMHGSPKYPAGFDHFDYVNPDAPKGGTLRQSVIGTYDNFNRFADRGVSAALSEGYFFDPLMVASADEIDVYYGLIAEKVEYPADYSWIIFDINPKARAQDGKPITSGDVVFSFDKFMTEGVPQFRQYYAGVKVEALDALRVKFTLKTGDRALAVGLASLTILPKSYWSGHKLTDPLTGSRVGTGAYTVKDYKIGQYVAYQRIPDYWAAGLPVIQGPVQLRRLSLRLLSRRDRRLRGFQGRGIRLLRGEHRQELGDHVYGTTLRRGLHRQGGAAPSDTPGHAVVRLQRQKADFPG